MVTIYLMILRLIILYNIALGLLARQGVMFQFLQRETVYCAAKYVKNGVVMEQWFVSDIQPG